MRCHNHLLAMDSFLSYRELYWCRLTTGPEDFNSVQLDDDFDEEEESRTLFGN